MARRSNSTFNIVLKLHQKGATTETCLKALIETHQPAEAARLINLFNQELNDEISQASTGRCNKRDLDRGLRNLAEDLDRNKEYHSGQKEKVLGSTKHNVQIEK